MKPWIHILIALVGVLLLGQDRGLAAVNDVVHSLRVSGFSGAIYPIGTKGYDTYRRVKNSACNVLHPLVIARPRSAIDVAIALAAARSHYLPVSVRSGGHGYTCNNLKNGSLHFDMRRMNKVKFVKGYQGRNGVRLLHLGPGSTWERVLSLVPPSDYTMVHGQCTEVGVAGYLLGGGVNVAGSATKYGVGAENVVEYEMVTASSEIVTVNKDGITKRSYEGHPITTVPNVGEDDLFFALKGAGSNYGIVTQFTYRVFPHPETKPVLVLIFIQSLKDLYKLQRLSDVGKLQISAYRIQHFRRLHNTLDNIQNLGLVSIVSGLKRLHSSKYEPMVALFTDLHSKGKTTNLNRVLKALRRAGLKNALPRTFGIDERLTRVLGLDQYNPNWPNYDTLYLSRAERMRMGKQAFTATSFMSGASPKLFEEIAFHHPLFSLKNDIETLDKDIGCDACNWFFTIWSPFYGKSVRFYAIDRTREGTRDTRWAFDFTCNYNPHNHYRAKRCQAAVDQVRYMLNRAAEKIGEPLHHYYNTPSCHNVANERPFHERYFGTNYGDLLRIKAKWDPDNVFNHCHSIGSTVENCCIT